MAPGKELVMWDGCSTFQDHNTSENYTLLWCNLFSEVGCKLSSEWLYMYGSYSSHSTGPEWGDKHLVFVLMGHGLRSLPVISNIVGPQNHIHIWALILSRHLHCNAVGKWYWWPAISAMFGPCAFCMCCALAWNFNILNTTSCGWAPCLWSFSLSLHFLYFHLDEIKIII